LSQEEQATVAEKAKVAEKATEEEKTPRGWKEEYLLGWATLA